MTGAGILWLACSIAAPIVTMFCVIGALRPGVGRRPTLWRLVLATWFGIGWSSLTWWFLLMSGFQTRRTRVGLDAAIWTVALLVSLVLYARRRTVAAADVSARESSPAGLVVAWSLLAIVGSLAAAAFVSQSIVLPHGTWDAFSIWNVKARFLLRGAGTGAWKDLFDVAIGQTHPDYPLLVPLSVARGWSYAGLETPAVPVTFAALCTIAVLGAAAGSLGRSRSALDGLAAALFLCASPAFVAFAPSQCADVPLSGFIVTTFALVAEAERQEANRTWWGLAGLAAGLAAWTKNEGLVFLVVSSGVCGLWLAWRLVAGNRARAAGPAAFFIGAAPVVAVLVTFKWLFSPGNDIMSAQNSGTLLAALTNPPRLAYIAGRFGRELWYGGAALVGVLPVLALYAGFRGIKRPLDPAVSFAIATVLGCLAVYFGVYAVIQYDLPWSIDTTLPRLIVQQTPAMVWIGLSLTRH